MYILPSPTSVLRFANFSLEIFPVSFSFHSVKLPSLSPSNWKSNLCAILVRSVGNSASFPSRWVISEEDTVFGGAEGMCGVGSKRSVASTEATERREMMDADVDWRRFGGEKGSALDESWRV